MNKLFVAALKEETVGLNYFYHVGVGKINATYNLIKLIQEHKPSEVINYGTAGAIKKELSEAKLSGVEHPEELLINSASYSFLN